MQNLEVTEFGCVGARWETPNKVVFRVGAETGRLHRKPKYGQPFRCAVLKYMALTRYSEMTHREGSGRISDHGIPYFCVSPLFFWQVHLAVSQGKQMWRLLTWSPSSSASKMPLDREFQAEKANDLSVEAENVPEPRD